MRRISTGIPPTILLEKPQLMQVLPIEAKIPYNKRLISYEKVLHSLTGMNPSK